MSNYATHTRFNLTVALPLCSALFYLYITDSLSHLLCFGAAFVWGTFFLNPDLDLVHQVKLFSLRGLLTAPLRWYPWLFKHRGLSHHFFLGTLSRVLCLGLISSLALYLVDHTGKLHRSFWILCYANKAYLACGLGGLFLADIAHLFQDILPRKRGRR